MTGETLTVSRPVTGGGGYSPETDAAGGAYDAMGIASHRRIGRVVNGRRVLVIDGCRETAQVLKAVLEPQGLRVDRIRSEITRSEDSLPDVLVLHQQNPRTGTSSRWDHVPRVVIHEGSNRDERPDRRTHYLRQPFHYRELLSAIDRLLDRRVA